jgi:tetratricopeptide (TPR) repeat protein
LVPARCWNFLCYGFTPQERSSPAFNPHINEWHRHNPPPGTAYNLLPRLDHPSLAFRPDAGDLVDKLHVLAPYDCNLNWFIWEVKFKANPTLEQATTLFQAILPYNSFAMEKVAATVRDQPARCEHLLAQAAEFNPAFHFALADYYAGHNADDQAAACIEKGTRLDPDPVQAAARASWLIKYYLKKGQLDAARREADLAGNGFSNRFGLQAKAEFLEATGNYPAADQWFGKILERYHDPEPVIAFCLRYKNQTGDARYDGELHQRVGGLFPRGIETVRLADLKTPPRDGALIQAENSSPFTASLHPGDVIVAVMGLRVHNVAQYTCARESTTNSLLDMIVWQGRGYHEIKSNPPGHRLGVELDDYMAR